MIHIIQPTTCERNLAGICYYPYWVYVALKEDNRDVSLYENVTMREVDTIFEKINKLDLVLIDLSSYPQIELALAIYRDFRWEFNIQFIGYNPLIESKNLPIFDIEGNNIDINKGVFNYIFYDKYFKYMLLNDCDNHIKNKDPRKMVPIFLGVGCKRKCPFCYVSATNYPYGFADADQIKKILDYCIENNYNIHFSDENFYSHPEIEFILQYLQNKNIKWICLTDSLLLTKMILKYGEEYLLSSGNFLNEIGLETADETNMSKKQNLDTIFKSKLNIFWLVVTFMPNETISSLNSTGHFHKLWGWKKEDLLKRIRTNSTEGGLGQFFQVYHGTEYGEGSGISGKIFSNYPTRLYPSYVGYKFLNDIPKINREINKSDEEWFDLYFLSVKEIYNLYKEIDGIKTVNEICKDNLDKIVGIAQLAKLNVISSVVKECI